MKSPVLQILAGLVLVVMGMTGGWFMNRGTGRSTTPTQVGTVHEDLELSPQTLANLQVEVVEATLGSYTIVQKVHAMVVDPEWQRRPVVAPVGGVVEEVHYRAGQVVGGGKELLVLRRDPIPRPELQFTGELVAPMSETLHESFLKLHKATIDLELNRTELRRLEVLAPKGETPLVTRQQVLEAGYAVQRAEALLQSLQAELEYHGFSAGQVAEVQGGKHHLRDQEVRMRALGHHGLWKKQARTLFDFLPEGQRSRPWILAAIAELEAIGQLDPQVVGAFGEHAALAAHAAETLSLLLGGSTLDEVVALGRAGALAPMVAVSAPASGDWDLVALPVRAGQRVERGDLLALLHRPDRVQLRLLPVGEEQVAVAKALTEGTSLTAAPLLVDTGPVLEGLVIERLVAGDQGSEALITVVNEPVAGPEGTRSWRLRTGLRYTVRIPVRTLDKVYVFPPDGVARQGPNRIVFERHGAHFHEVPVHVLHEDESAVVVAADGAFEEGDEIVVRGAFALSLALQVEAGGGHTHPH